MGRNVMNACKLVKFCSTLFGFESQLDAAVMLAMFLYLFNIIACMVIYVTRYSLLGV